MPTALELILKIAGDQTMALQIDIAAAVRYWRWEREETGKDETAVEW